MLAHKKNASASPAGARCGESVESSRLARLLRTRLRPPGFRTRGSQPFQLFLQRLAVETLAGKVHARRGRSRQVANVHAGSLDRTHGVFRSTRRAWLYRPRDGGYARPLSCRRQSDAMRTRDACPLVLRGAGQRGLRPPSRSDARSERPRGMAAWQVAARRPIVPRKGARTRFASSRGAHPFDRRRLPAAVRALLWHPEDRSHRAPARR